MNILQRFQAWGDSHHPKWLDIIRIILGLFLIYKGIDFITHMSELISLMKSTFGSFAYVLAGQYVVFAHLLGGFLLVIGLFTRFACLIQIPILLGALIFLDTNKELLSPYADFAISIVVLLLLVYFLIIGDGPLSFKIPAEEKKRSEREHE